MIKKGFLKAYGIDYNGTIPKIKKSENKLQPLFEALTNSFEAISIKGASHKRQEIKIRCFFSKNLFSDEENDYNFEELQIEDNGVGFNDSEFERAISLNDNRKGFSNKGTGRVQFLHFFDKTEVVSIYKDPKSSTGYFERTIEFSKRKQFLDKNAIIKHVSTVEIKAKKTKTTLSFRDTLAEKDKSFFDSLEIESLKSEIINHFLVYLCDKKDSLPKFEIEFWLESKLKGKSNITSSDLPEVNYETDISIPYRELALDGKEVSINTEDRETFNLKSFVISKEELSKNELILTSKGQRAKAIKLKSLSPNDQINSNRYLFLLSGDYIDAKDSDTRGIIKIPKLEEFKKSGDGLFQGKTIILDDIEEEANNVIEQYYSEIKKKTKDKLKNIEKLKNMFLLNPETIKSLSIGLNETDDQILKKVYESDIKIIAKRDAEIKHQIEQLDKLNTKSKTYKAELEETIFELVKTIPIQNRSALTHYVARRKLVLDLFDKILSKQIDILNGGGRIDEDIMHNLIFQQSSEDPSDSDLWIINEEFIYFNGFSEYLLKNVKIKGVKLFKEKFEEEEERYLTSLGSKRLDRRPDILLFPEDGKCIIIELKAPDVDASAHLTQIDMYASLIRNYTCDEFEITRFYGHLIGESIEPRDVLGRVSNYEITPNFGYLFRPSQRVHGFDGRSDGSIYSEVIKYSTLLARAKLRNKVFIDKLTD